MRRGKKSLVSKMGRARSSFLGVTTREGKPTMARKVADGADRVSIPPGEEALSLTYGSFATRARMLLGTSID
jgi:hypothetical protein